ncbi:MAG: hypothetical protein R2778_01395 [Saprospiraceae bacterium]
MFQQACNLSNGRMCGDTARSKFKVKPYPTCCCDGVIQADGSIEDFYGPGTITIQRITESESYLRYQQLELPLMLGLTARAGKHWAYDVSAGGLVSLYGHYSGNVSGVSGEQSLSSFIYRKSELFRFRSSLAACTRHQKGAIGLTLSGRTGLNGMTSSDAVFEERRSSLSVGVVLRRGFNALSSVKRFAFSQTHLTANFRTYTSFSWV